MEMEQTFVPVPIHSETLTKFNVQLRSVTTQQVIEMATRFLLYNNMRKAARESGICEQSAGQYKQYEWWEPLLAEIREHFDENHRAGLTRIVDTGIREMEDRMNHGDFQINKDGSVERVPVKLRDLTYATGIGIDKLAAMRRQYEQELNTKQELKRLSQQFAQLSGHFDATIVSDESGASVFAEFKQND